MRATQVLSYCVHVSTEGAPGLQKLKKGAGAIKKLMALSFFEFDFITHSADTAKHESVSEWHKQAHRRPGRKASEYVGIAEFASVTLQFK